mmetsp:Transcript_30339/g.86789  ORF Transcript_30339/g.86789 Transcript_30339/m.86789 type:complete len:259 (-) Transcript_30339:85-861(-)
MEVLLFDQLPERGPVLAEDPTHRPLPACEHGPPTQVQGQLPDLCQLPAGQHLPATERYLPVQAVVAEEARQPQGFREGLLRPIHRCRPAAGRGRRDLCDEPAQVLDVPTAVVNEDLARGILPQSTRVRQQVPGRHFGPIRPPIRMGRHVVVRQGRIQLDSPLRHQHTDEQGIYRLTDAVQLDAVRRRRPLSILFVGHPPPMHDQQAPSPRELCPQAPGAHLQVLRRRPRRRRLPKPFPCPRARLKAQVSRRIRRIHRI